MTIGGHDLTMSDDKSPEKGHGTTATASLSQTVYKEDQGGPHGLITTEKAKLDIAAEFLLINESKYGNYTPAESSRVRWKIDLRLVPMLFVTQTLCAIDKIAISNAALYGMKTDTHISGTQYSWVGSIFFFGYLAAEFPGSALVQKLPVGKVAATLAISWGSATMILGACQNAGGLLAVRFIQGMFEAPIVPALSIMTVMWWTKKEQPVRVAMWYSGFSSLFTGIISYGVGHSHSAVASWRLLFIVLGGFTFLWGLFILAFLPDTPLTARFLNEKEKFIALHRIKGNKTGVENKTIKWYQVRECFTDVRTYPPICYAIAVNLINGATGVFAAQIVASFGYGPLETVLLGMPTGMFMTASALLVAIPNMWLKNMRIKICAASAIVPLIAALLVKHLPESNRKGRLVSYYFMFFFWAAYPSVISLVMANTSGHSKKVTMNAILFFSYCVGNIVAPHFWIASESPNYPTGFNSCIAGAVIAVTMLIIYEIIVRWDNRKKEKLYGKFEDEVDDAEDQLDITDREKRTFRYVY